MSELSKMEERERVLGWATFGFIVIAVAVRLYILYLPFRIFGYLVPPGGDPVNHFAMVQDVLSGKYSFDYPKFFHIIIAKISLLSGLGIMDTLKLVTPALVVLPSIAIYIFAKKEFGRLAGVLSFIITLWTSNYGLIAFGDGNYPNILAAGFFMPLALLYLLESFKKGSLKNYLLAVLFAVLTLSTHHLTTAMMIVIVISFIAVLGVWHFYERVAPNYKKTALAIVITGVVIAILVSFTSLNVMFKAAWEGFSQTGKFFNDNAFIKPIAYVEYPPQIGPLAWFGGIASMIALIYLLGQSNGRKNKPTYLLLLVWIVALYLMSRTGIFGLPGRFARELGVPLILSLGLSLSFVIHRLTSNLQKIFTLGLVGFIIAINLVQINGGAYTAPEFFNKMIWFGLSDKSSADSIESLTPEGSVIIANPTSPYLPIFASGRSIKFATLKLLNDPAGYRTLAKESGVEYIFIGKKTASGPDENTYAFFANFDKITANLEIAVAGCKKVAGFDPNSALYDLKACPAIPAVSPVVKK